MTYIPKSVEAYRNVIEAVKDEIVVCEAWNEMKNIFDSFLR